MMRLLAVMLVFQLCIATDKAKRIEVEGPFSVCDAGHFDHAACFDRWRGGCPRCHTEVRDERVIIVESAFFAKDAGDACSFCLEEFEHESSSTPTIVSRPVSPTIPKDKDVVALPEAQVLATLYTDLTNLRPASINTSQAKRFLLDWNNRKRMLNLAIKDQYLRAAMTDTDKADLILRAETDPAAKRYLLAKIKAQQLHEFQRARSKDSAMMLPDRLDIIDILNEKIRE